eukprot:g5791.t1
MYSKNILRRAQAHNNSNGNYISNKSIPGDNIFVKFLPHDEIVLANCSPDALFNLMSFVADAATSLNSLRRFSRIYNTIEISATRGSVWQAFAQAVGTYVDEIERKLMHFEMDVNQKYYGIEKNDSINKNFNNSNARKDTVPCLFTLIDLVSRLKETKANIEFVLTFVEDTRKLCNAEYSTPRDCTCIVLSQIYTMLDDATLQAAAFETPFHTTKPDKYVQNKSSINSQNIVDKLEISFKIDVLSESSILLHFFKITVATYLSILDSWLYEGKLIDPYNEFFIRKNDDNIDNDALKIDLFRSNENNVDGATIWKKGYVLLLDKAPHFLRQYAAEIYLCGKSEAVLRRILSNMVSTSGCFVSRRDTDADADILLMMNRLIKHVEYKLYEDPSLRKLDLANIFTEKVNNVLKDFRNYNNGNLENDIHILSNSKNRSNIEKKFFRSINFTLNRINQHVSHASKAENNMEIITPSDRININENIFSSGAAALKVLNSDDLSGVNSQIKKDKQHNRIYIQPNVKSYLRRIEVNGNVENTSLFSYSPFILHINQQKLDYIGSININKFLKASIIHPMLNKSKDTNNFLVNILVNNMKLTTVLDTLRMCYFFSNVELMEDFIFGLFNAVDGNKGIRDDNGNNDFKRNITKQLRKTLQKHPAKYMAHIIESEKWSAGFRNIQNNGVNINDGDRFSNNQMIKENSKHVSANNNYNKQHYASYDSVGALDTLYITYRPSWPIDLIIDNDAIRSYNEIMSSLLRVKRVKYSVDALHQSIRNKIVAIDKKMLNNNHDKVYTPRDAQFKEHAHKYMLFVGELRHFANNLHNYLVESCVYGNSSNSWDAVKTEIREASSVDDLRYTHFKYLSTLKRTCMLDPKTKVISDQIRKLLNISLHFMGAIRRWLRLGCQDVEWKGDQVRYDLHLPYTTITLNENRELTQALIHLSDLQHQFKKTNKFLHMLLASLIKRAHGSYDHIKDVLLRLDYNFYYNNKLTSVDTF